MKIPLEITQKMKKYTAFQQRVWETCASIPKGETRTYGWIAKQMGNPKASRAVGSALAMNPFAPTIPCHRVISSTGQLGNYSGPGGVATKLRLLKTEGWNQNGKKRN